jgi:hypothetical protein
MVAESSHHPVEAVMKPRHHVLAASIGLLLTLPATTLVVNAAEKSSGHPGTPESERRRMW